MELTGKQVVVVGMAQTGIALARFCAERGARVVCTDNRPATALGAAMGALSAYDIRWEVGGHDAQSFVRADLVTMSPGVPNLPEMKAAKAAGVPIMAEIELAFRFLHPHATLIAITGTNGKSTTTALTGSLCAASGRPTFCGGNLGNMPMIDCVEHVANQPGGLIVVEVAAFMLEHCQTFAPHVGVLTNITPDHLDRFGTMERYAEMKGRIWQWQTETQVAIANAEDTWTMAETAGIASRLATFSSAHARSTPAHALSATLSTDRHVLELHGVSTTIERYPTDDLVIVGNHNMENAMAAYLAARFANVSPDAVRAGARAYRPLPHRMERVAEKAGILYFDDSKGTNVASVAASMRGFPHPFVLIAGGVDKGGSYAPMLDAIADGCRGLIVIGAAAPLIANAAADANVPYPVVHATSMQDAVAKATAQCRPGDAVVLSPACASYDMFDNYGHRGRVFRECAAALGARRLDL